MMKLLLSSFLWLLFVSAKGSELQDKSLSLISNFVENLAKGSATEINLVWGKTNNDHNRHIPSIRRLAAELSKVKTEVPISLYDQDLLQKRSADETAREQCPLFYPYGNVTGLTHTNSHFKRVNNIIPAIRRPRMILISLESEMSVENWKALFSATILNCTQKLDYGPFGSDSTIVFVSASKMLIEKSLQFELTKRHPRIIGLQLIMAPRPSMNVWQLSPYERHKSSLLSFTWDPKLPSVSLRNLIRFPSQFDGEKIVSSIENYNQKLDENGYLPRSRSSKSLRVETILILEKHLGAKIYLKPTPTIETAFLDDKGNYLGDQYLLSKNLVDVASTSYLQFHNAQLAEVCPVLHLPNFYMTFAAPLPQPLPTTLALIYPFEARVWLAFLISLIGFVIGIGVIDFIYQKMYQERQFPGIRRLVRFALASVLKQDYKIISGLLRFNAFRLSFLIWLFYILIMTAGYSSNLLSFLINPGYERQIESVSDILESGLPWYWFQNYASGESLIARSNEPELQQLWRGRIVQLPGQGVSINEVLKDVMEGKSVLVSSSLMSFVANVAYRAPNGELMIYYSQKPILEATNLRLISMFPKLSRWSRLMTKTFRRILETGIDEPLLASVLGRIKTMYIERGLMYDFSHVASEETSLGLHEMQGILIVFLVLTVFSLLIFAWEKIAFAAKKRKSESHC